MSRIIFRIALRIVLGCYGAFNAGHSVGGNDFIMGRGLVSGGARETDWSGDGGRPNAPISNYAGLVCGAHTDKVRGVLGICLTIVKRGLLCCIRMLGNHLSRPWRNWRLL